ncbi:hypothetical protein PENTCL1PPCAC_8535 [Pristionchus entomophagus]|uniref:Protein kinase domain-containing protein n=1 Tax=Pristionchus entomophagus TaxID=358040 RepID=A0AAV5STF1_9BILA|nr:hypothetical protein PENTCL1PPCAC_8535 [Pristionchus entomophagus]
MEQEQAKVACVFEKYLPDHTTCYQLEHGSVLLFKYERPYALSSVSNVSGRKVDAILPTLKDPLTCAGVYRDALYFYSTPPMKCTYTFYRATIDLDDMGTVVFAKIREIRINDDIIRFAHKQPFYVMESKPLCLYGFEKGDCRSVPLFNRDSIFFQHRGILFTMCSSECFTMQLTLPFIDVLSVEIAIPEPEKTAIFSREDTGFLYIISKGTMYVFSEDKLKKEFQLHCPQNDARSRIRNFDTVFDIVVVDGPLMVISAPDTTDGSTLFWRMNLHDQESVSHMSGNCDVPNTLTMLKILTKQKRQAAIQPVSNIVAQKKVPTSTGKIILKKPSEAKSSKPVGSNSKVKKIVNDHAIELQKSMESICLPDVEEAFDSEFLRRFKPINILGQGRYGCVFEAERNVMGVTWKRAVKRIALRSSKKDAFSVALKEVEVQKDFNHEGIVKFDDAWIETPPTGWQRYSDDKLLEELNSKEIVMNCSLLLFSYVQFQIPYKVDCVFLYIQMELCDSSLAEWLISNKERDLIKIKMWFKQIVLAVAYIHEKGKIHRDLKPSNILISNEGRLKICDLGIVAECVFENGQERDKSRTYGQWTPMYMAPEQMSWIGYKSKVDIFALGLILVELCVVMTMEHAAEVFDMYRADRATTVLDHLPEVKEFVAWLSNVRATERPECREILEHPFLS